MGRSYDQVIENRRQLAETIRQNISQGFLLGAAVDRELLMPVNPVSEVSYRGINRMCLILAAFERKYNDPRWMTFEQIRASGYHLKKGSKGVFCEYWDFGQKITNELEDEVETPVTPKVGYYHVFNATDIEGIPEYTHKTIDLPERTEIQSFVASSVNDSGETSEIQKLFVRLFAELEQGVSNAENYVAKETHFEVDDKEIFQMIRRAQKQSEIIAHEYDKKLLESIETVEIITDEKIESKDPDTVSYLTEPEQMILETVEKQEVTDNSKEGKIEDFGRKIGGARKDLWSKRGLSLEDVAQMNTAEREKFITKNNIWIKPDYEGLVQNGIPANVVWFIKKVHDKLRTKPVNAQTQTEYIAFVEDLRDKVMNLRTELDCIGFRNSFLREGNYVRSDGVYGLSPTEKSAGCVDRKLYQALRVDDYDFRIIYPREMQKAQFLVPAEEKLPRGVKIGYNRKLEKFFVMKGGKVYERFDTREEAVAYAKEEMSHTKTSKRTFVPPQLMDIKRTGLESVVHGDITGQNYIDTFGFYGGEFGNWMSLADRQQSLNLGYEALHDMAIALDIADEEISFNGKLAIAFGSRGKGNAAAHYEPLRQVINLTKMKGAGSLAHEWGHALDHLLSLRMGNSEMMSRMGEQTPEVMRKLLDTMKYKDGSNGKELTDFYQDSKLFDLAMCKSDKGYWASDCEMFARAFACYVKDKLSPGRSDYLCGHADLYVALVGTPSGETKKAVAFPMGEERKIINRAMDTMIQELKEQKLLLGRGKEMQLDRSLKIKHSL